ncbi:MAG TPA: hypothetical protein PKY23_07400, partial [Bacillota bacterium]|nr:hypothetical protein [Bacillota bacterium]
NQGHLTPSISGHYALAATFSPRNKCSNTSPYEKRSFFFTFKKVIFELFSDKWDLLDSPFAKGGLGGI